VSGISPLALVSSRARVGSDCTIEDHTLIEPEVTIGAGVTIRFGVALRNGTVIEDGVIIGANVCFSDELGPKSGATVLKRGAIIGAQTVIRSGVTIGERAIVHPGSYVTEHVPPLAIVQGNPAHIVGYNGAQQPAPRRPGLSTPAVVGVAETTIERVTLHRLPSAADMRGQLSYGEIGQHVPFEVKRFFLVYGVAGKEVRGEHAHRNLHQFLICVHGECSVVADDGSRREEFLLDDPTLGLLVPPMVWAVQYKHSADAVLLVLASDRYDPDDYIRDYSEFCVALDERAKT
jgi:UDP-2-acetamido-3-amino-2,3-dideoxy-glucuronate N-acetyltransferase